MKKRFDNNVCFQYEASKTNSMVEAALAGSWLCVIFWLGGFVLILVQKFYIRQQKIEQVGGGSTCISKGGGTCASLATG